MFGLLRPCRTAMGTRRSAEYQAHMCGACLGLRDQAGQVARITLNKDALVLAMLIEHLSGAGDRVRAGRCPLRGMRGAEVIDPASAAAAYAGAVSLVLAHVSLADHATDGDRHGLVATLGLPVVARMRKRALDAFPQLRSDFDRIAECVAREARVRSVAGRGLAAYVEHTELAFGVGFGAVAALAGRPGLRPVLTGLGSAYGRIAAIIDALEDMDEDVARGQFNLILASFPRLAPDERMAAARAELLAGAARIADALRTLAVDPDATVHFLLADALRARINTALGQVPSASRPAPGPRHALAVAVSLVSFGMVDSDHECGDACCEGCGEACGEGCSEACCSGCHF
jgi:Family of unknown function (DUF5685)